MTYSNNPNHHYEGDRDNTHPGLPLNVPTEVLGETVEDIVITYLTQLQITKTDEDRQILPGAQFTLTGVSKQTVLKGGDQFVQYGANETVDATNVWYQLTDGSYTNTAPTAQQMVEITEEPEGGYVRGYVVAASTYNENDVITVDGVRYRFYRTGDTDVRVYALQAPNGEAYYSTTTLYKKVSAQSNTVVERLVTLTGTSNDQGLIVFEGIGEGTFTITETITPAGYNTAEPITITTDAKIETTDAHGNIVEVELEEATISEATQQCKWISTSGDADNPNYGAFTVQTAGVNPGSGYLATIINRAGTLLPSTGGIGTTIFYVVGGILVIGAGILLVAKKRMSNRR